MSRVALVTGASRGIGKAVAEVLGDAGFAVAVNYARSATAADDVARKIRAAGGSALTVRANVADADEVGAMFTFVRAELGPVGVLVNNAGITRDNLILRMSAASWDEVMATNLRSVFLCSKAALRDMVKGRWGRIISVASVAGVAGNAGQVNYAASKAGVIGVTKSLAKEVGSRNITVNAVAPGWIETDLTTGISDEVKTRALDAISLGAYRAPRGGRFGGWLSCLRRSWLYHRPNHRR